MTPLQIELTKLIWKKELTFGCKVIITRSVYKLSDEQKEYLADKHWKCILSDELEENGEWHLYIFNEDDLVISDNSTYEWACISWLDIFKQVRVQSEWHTEQTISIIRNRTVYESWKPNVRFDDYWYSFQEVSSVLGHPATISDFHVWMNEKHLQWKQLEDVIYIVPDEWASIMIMYNSSKDFLDQDEETLKQIVSLVKETKIISSNQ